MDNIRNEASSGATTPGTQANATFDRIAPSVSKDSLSQELAHVFNSEATPPFEQMVAELFAHSTPEQKSGLLNQLITTLGPAGVTQALAGAPSAATAGALTAPTVSPQQAQQVSPPVVQSLAQQAVRKDPAIVQQAAGFYAQHPTLVKAVGAGALALLVSRLTSARH